MQREIRGDTPSLYAGKAMEKLEWRGKWARFPLECRSEDGALIVEGYAAVFNQETNIGGQFIERIAPGAFTEAVGRDEVVFLFNHDSDTVMARTSAGNLDLSEDEKGLRIVARLDSADPDVQRTTVKMRNGNVNKMSFAFLADGEEWADNGGLPVRTVTRASLFDVSAVTDPAYKGTEIGLRSLEQHRQREQGKHNHAAALRRMRMNTRLRSVKG